MIWKVPEIIANLSKLFRAAPGRHHPHRHAAGVGPVVPGDELVGSIDGLGTLTVRISDSLHQQQ